MWKTAAVAALATAFLTSVSWAQAPGSASQLAPGQAKPAGTSAKPFIVPPTTATQKQSFPPNQNADVWRDYEFAIQIGSKEALESFLAKHPNGGLYTAFAKQQLAKLSAPTSEFEPSQAPEESGGK
jgi:hypothetical protein